MQNHHVEDSAPDNFGIGDIDPFDAGTEMTYNMGLAGYDVRKSTGQPFSRRLRKCRTTTCGILPDAAEPLEELEAAIARNDGLVYLWPRSRRSASACNQMLWAKSRPAAKRSRAGGGGGEEGGAGVFSPRGWHGDASNGSHMAHRRPVRAGDIDLSRRVGRRRGGAIEMTELRNQTNELMRQTVAGEEAGAFEIQPFREQDIAVKTKGEFWITQQGLRNWVAAARRDLL